MSYVEGNLLVYYYGGNEATAPFPIGSGTGPQIFKDIVQTAKSTGQKFEDPNFSADTSTLQDDSGSDTSSNSSGDTTDIKWFRPPEIAQALKYEPIFHGPYDEFAVVQGDLGDCWWLSVLGVITTKPECIKTIVPVDNETVGWDTGVFHFRFWCRGEWIDVVVDDRLPCVVDNNKITGTLYTHPTPEGGFWVPLLEKAYAKLYGTYGDISKGNSTDAMIDFTGGISFNYLQPNPKKSKPMLKNSQKLDAIVSLSTKKTVSKKIGMASSNSSNPGPEGETTTGIVLDHEYSLLDVQDVQDNNDSTLVYTLLKLRNPWGNSAVWNGNFSYSNNMWNTVTPNLGDETGEQNHGEFWIDHDDFILNYCSEIDFCLWSKKYRGYKTEKTPDGGEFFIKHGYFTAENSGEHRTDDIRKQKPGFYAYLKSTDSRYNLSGEIEQLDGLDCNCDVNIIMIYSNYKDTVGTGIKEYGYLVYWAPGQVDPGSHKMFEGQSYEWLTSGYRSQIFQKHLPEGTILIIPWLKHSPPTDTSTPYFLRIALEGDVLEYDPNN